MNTFLTVLHVLVCLFLILVVLLQAGKGGGMGIAFGGGGSQTVFGSSGAGNFLTRLTSITAVIFMVTSLALAHNSSQQDSKRLQRLEGRKAAEKKTEDDRLAKLKAEIEKASGAKATQSASPTTPVPGAAPAAAPELPLNHPPLRLTAPKFGDKTGDKPGESDSESAKPAKAEKPAKAGKEAATPAAPGEKPKRKKKAPAAEGDTSAAPPPAPATAPPPTQ